MSMVFFVKHPFANGLPENIVPLNRDVVVHPHDIPISSDPRAKDGAQELQFTYDETVDDTLLGKNEVDHHDQKGGFNKNES